MVSHRMIIEFIILIPVIINFLTIFPNNKKVSVLWVFLAHPVYIYIYIRNWLEMTYDTHEHNMYI